jgi:DNA uptake protein ComE-like DNA-binding protein
MPEFLKDYFSFTRKERIGVLVLVTLMIIIFILPEIIPFTNEDIDKNLISISRQVQAEKSSPQKESVGEREDGGYNEKFYEPRPEHAAPANNSLFFFDPNTVSAEGWRTLGLKDKTILTIQHYLSKGGRFKSSEDIRKIYGIHTDLADRLIPYIIIKKVEKNNQPYQKKSFHVSEERKQPLKPAFIHSPVDINLADSMAFERLPGIGPKLAARIIHFRNKLGGFYSIDQVAETYALPDSTFQHIKPFLKMESPGIKQIDINIADSRQLHNHPYINWNLANAIIQYRQQHGKFKETVDLLQIEIISPEIFKRLSPYLLVSSNHN